MAEQTNEFMTATPSEGGEFELLETGAYSAICVGLTKKEFKKYQSTEMEPKFQFVFQVHDGDTNHYLRTLPFRNVMNEKSNLFQFLSSWLGVTFEKAAGGLDLGKCVGLKAQVVVDVEARDNKQYNIVSNVLKAKKTDPVAFVPDAHAPAWLNKGPFIAAHWIDGLGFAEAKAPKPEFSDEDLLKFAESKKAENVSSEIGSTSDDEAGLPF